MGRGADAHAPWHCLNFLPDPHGQGALRGVFSHSDLTTGVLTTGSSTSGDASSPSAAAWARAAAAIVFDASLGSVGAVYCTLPMSACAAGCSATVIWACMTY